MLGNYQVLIKLYEKESATVKINVASDRVENEPEAAEGEETEEAKEE
jgi:hypothetical protein